jgi:hypothetical protein
VVQRQRERDVPFLLAVVDGLSRPQIALLSHLNMQVRRYRPTALPALVDADIREAAAAMASTLETTARGILYEHQTQSLPAQRVLALFKDIQREVESRGSAPPALVGKVFRRLELAARDAATQVGGGETAFLDFLDRVAAGAVQGGDGEPGAPPANEPEGRDQPRIIVP